MVYYLFVTHKKEARLFLVVNGTIELLSRLWPQLKVAAAVHSESNVFAMGLIVAVG